MKDRRKLITQTLEVCEKLIDGMTEKQLEKWLAVCEGAAIMSDVKNGRIEEKAAG